MKIVLLVIFLIIILFISAVIVNAYINIKNQKIKRGIVIISFAILILAVIAIIAFLFNFFNLLTQIQPL